MPDQYGNPTFADLFSNPDVFRHLYNNFIPAIQQLQQQPNPPQFQGAQQVPVPKRTGWDELRDAFASASGGLTDASRIYQGAAVEGLGQKYQQSSREQFDEATRRAQMFNVGQENQFGRVAQQQDFQTRLQAEKQADIAERQAARLSEQTTEAQRSREAADARNRVIIESREREGKLDRESRERIAKMNLAGKAATTANKPPPEGAVKEATTIASLADSLKSAEDAFNANVIAHPSRIGQTMSGAGSEFLPKLLGHNVGQSAASSAYPEAQFAEGQLNALSAVIDKLRTGNSRFAIQLYNALRPLVPTVGLSPENAAKKFKMLRQNLDAVLRTRLKLAPNQAIALEDIQRAVEEDMGRIPVKPGQRIPSPPPPPAGTVKKSLDDIWNESR